MTAGVSDRDEASVGRQERARWASRQVKEESESGLTAAILSVRKPKPKVCAREVGALVAVARIKGTGGEGEGRRGGLLMGIKYQRERRREEMVRIGGVVLQLREQAGASKSDGVKSRPSGL